jgi:WD40 repeat protein
MECGDAGECEQTLAGHTDYVYSASFSPDGEKVVSASRDKNVRLWRVDR